MSDTNNYTEWKHIDEQEWEHIPLTDIQSLQHELKSTDPNARMVKNSAIEHFSVLVRYACHEDLETTFDILQKYLQEYPKSRLVSPWLTGHSIGQETFQWEVQQTWFQIQRLLPVEDAIKNMAERLTMWMDKGEYRPDETSPIPGIVKYMDGLGNYNRQQCMEFLDKRRSSYRDDPQWLHGALRFLLNNEDLECQKTWLGNYIVSIFRYHLLHATHEDLDPRSVYFASGLKPAKKHTLWPLLGDAFHAYFQRLTPDLQESWFDILAQDCYITSDTTQILKEIATVTIPSTRHEMSRYTQLDMRFPQCITDDEDNAIYAQEDEWKKAYLECLFTAVFNGDHNMTMNCNTDESPYEKLKKRLTKLVEQTNFLTSEQGLHLWVRSPSNAYHHERALYGIGSLFGFQVYDPINRKWNIDAQVQLLCTLDQRLTPNQVSCVYQQWSKQLQLHKEMELPTPEFTLTMLHQALQGQNYAIDLDLGTPSITIP